MKHEVTSLNTKKTLAASLKKFMNTSKRVINCKIC